MSRSEESHETWKSAFEEAEESGQLKAAFAEVRSRSFFEVPQPTDLASIGEE